MNKWETFLSVTLAGAVIVCCGGCTKTPPNDPPPVAGPAGPDKAGDPGAESGDATPKVEPHHQRELEKLRTGSEKDRAAAADELRKAGPAAAATAAALCELATRPDRRIEALLALETVAPTLFGPVRTLTTADDPAAEIDAAGKLGALGVEGRPAAVVLRWHLARASARTAKQAPDVGRIQADLATLVRLAPRAPDTLKTLKTYLTFNADDNDNKFPTESLHRSVVGQLASVAGAVPERRAEVAGILVPLLDDKLLRLSALKALPACAQEAVRGRPHLNKLRFDSAPDVQKEADAVLAEISEVEKAAAKITDVSPKALATQSMDKSDRWLRQLAREKLGKVHPALEEYAKLLGEDLFAQPNVPVYVATLNGLKPPSVHGEIVPQLLVAHMKRIEKGAKLQACAQALLRLAPKAEETRETLLALSGATSAAVFSKNRTLTKEEAVWFGDELVAHFPEDPAVTQLLLDASRPVVGRTDTTYAGDDLVFSHGARVVRSLGRLADAQPKARKQVAEQLGAILNGRRWVVSTLGRAAYLSGIDPDALAVALIACREEAVPIIDRITQAKGAPIDDDQYEGCVEKAQAGLRKFGAK